MRKETISYDTYTARYTAHSPIMERLRLVDIFFWDVGGVLFPDQPTEDTRPNHNVLKVARMCTKLAGAINSYVCANVSDRRNEFKDYLLFEKFKVYKQTGLIPDRYQITAKNDREIDLGLADHTQFLKCNGPMEKGPVLAAKIKVQTNLGYQVLPIIIDNRLIVAFCCPPEAHCLMYRERKKGEIFAPYIEHWLRSNPPRLYHLNSPREIAKTVVEIHLQFVRGAALRSDEDPQVLRELYKEEVRRVQSIFHLRINAVPRVLRNLNPR